jgi:hypothetical protein
MLEGCSAFYGGDPINKFVVAGFMTFGFIWLVDQFLNALREKK